MQQRVMLPIIGLLVLLVASDLVDSKVYPFRSRRHLNASKIQKRAAGKGNPSFGFTSLTTATKACYVSSPTCGISGPSNYGRNPFGTTFGYTQGDQIPWMAKLFGPGPRNCYASGRKTNTLDATAVIINEFYLIVPACSTFQKELGDVPLSDMYVVAGHKNPYKEDLKKHKVADIIYHPIFDGRCDGTSPHDVALIELSEPLELIVRSPINSVCLPKTSGFDYGLLFTSGWTYQAWQSYFPVNSFPLNKCADLQSPNLLCVYSKFPPDNGMEHGASLFSYAGSPNGPAFLVGIDLYTNKHFYDVENDVVPNGPVDIFLRISSPSIQDFINGAAEVCSSTGPENLLSQD